MRVFGPSSTELKVRKATNEDEKTGATGTLMNEISVLTYSPKTVREITQVLKRRLSSYGRRTSHKNSIHIVKALTLILYLINNGSEEFVAWVRGNLIYFECLKSCEVSQKRDEPLAKQIRSMSNQICDCVKDDELLENKKKEIIEFRSSISSPGRKSTDNSHLKLIGVAKGSLERTPISLTNQKNENVTLLSEYQYAPNPDIYYRRGTTSLDLRRRNKGSANEISVIRLDPLEEENEARSIQAKGWKAIGGYIK